MLVETDGCSWKVLADGSESSSSAFVHCLKWYASCNLTQLITALFSAFFLLLPLYRIPPSHYHDNNHNPRFRHNWRVHGLLPLPFAVLQRLYNTYHAHGSDIHPFQSASGYSGGFLAKDWFSPASTELGELSFPLHLELAREFDGRRKWGYLGATALSLSVQEAGVGGRRQRGEDWLLEGMSRREVATNVASCGGGEVGFLREDGSPDWITKQEGGTLEVISSEGVCAQVEPYLLCRWLLDRCVERRVKVMLGSRATGVKKDEMGMIDEVSITKRVEGQEDLEMDLHCTNILIAAGVWTPRVFETLFPESKLRIPIEPLAGYSIVVRSPRHTLVHDQAYGGAHSLFCAPGKNWKFAPEAIGRNGRDGQTEIYVAGLNSSTLPLPELATDKEEDEEARKELRDVTVLLSGLSKEGADVNEDDLEVVRPGGKPILCKVEHDQLGKNTSGMAEGEVFLSLLAMVLGEYHSVWARAR